MDPATLAIGAAVGGSVGTMAAIIVFGLTWRFAWHLWRELDGQRTERLEILSATNGDLMKRVEALEAAAKIKP